MKTNSESVAFSSGQRPGCRLPVGGTVVEMNSFASLLIKNGPRKEE